jgi:hypothetical protein
MIEHFDNEWLLILLFYYLVIKLYNEEFERKIKLKIKDGFVWIVVIKFGYLDILRIIIV